MKTLEYALVTLLIAGLCMWGAITLAESIADSFDNAANRIEARP